MKKILFFLLAVSLFGACRYRSGSGNIISEKRNAGSFNAIQVAGGFEVEIKYGTSNELTVEADDNIIKYINTNNVNGVLKIRLDKINIHDAHLKIFIEAPEINAIKASAAADVTVKDILKSDELIDFQVSSGAEITTNLDAPEVKAEASSGGEIKLSGRTRDLDVSVSSGSEINAKDLMAENTKAGASSGGTARVHASVSLDAKASSGGAVKYRGAAAVKQSVSSGGNVEKD